MSRNKAVLASIVVFVLLFGGLFLAVTQGDTQPYDRNGLVWIHHLVGSGSVRQAFYWLTYTGYPDIYGVVIALALVVFSYFRWFVQAVRLAISYAGAQVTELAVKNIAHRTRPLEPWTLGRPTTMSFPSGHAMVSVALYAFLAFLIWRRLRDRTGMVVLVVGVLFAVLLAFSRLVLAVHYPSDVIGGMLDGLIWALVAVAIPLRRGIIPAQTPDPTG